jgi:hypothetical protein
MLALELGFRDYATVATEALAGGTVCCEPPDCFFVPKT